MKTIKFQMIADSRFTPNIKAEIERLDNLTIKTLTDNGIEFDYHRNAETLKWEDGTSQERSTFCIRKPNGRGKHTYNQIYSIVNSVTPVKFKVY